MPHSHPLPVWFRTGWAAWWAIAVISSSAPPLRAYEIPLNPAALHDAWTLGQRNDQATAEFLAPYAKQVTEGPPNAPHVAEIEVLTPFAQVVDECRQNLSNYPETKAVQVYHQRSDT